MMYMNTLPIALYVHVIAPLGTRTILDAFGNWPAYAASSSWFLYVCVCMCE